MRRPSSSSVPTSARGQDPLDPVLFVDRSSGSDRPHPSCTSTARIRADPRLPPSPASPRRRSRSSVRQAPHPCFVSLREELRRPSAAASLDERPRLGMFVPAADLFFLYNDQSTAARPVDHACSTAPPGPPPPTIAKAQALPPQPASFTNGPKPMVSSRLDPMHCWAGLCCDPYLFFFQYAYLSIFFQLTCFTV